MSYMARVDLWRIGETDPASSFPIGRDLLSGRLPFSQPQFAERGIRLSFMFDDHHLDAVPDEERLWPSPRERALARLRAYLNRALIEKNWGLGDITLFDAARGNTMLRVLGAASLSCSFIGAEPPKGDDDRMY